MASVLDDIDFGDLDGEAVEQGGALDVDGWYRAELERLELNEKQTSLMFRFRCTHGPFRGSVSTEFIDLPEWVANDEARDMVARKLACWLHRLGLWDGVKGHKPDMSMPSPALGAPVVLHIKTRRWKDKKTGAEKSATGIDFAGVFPLDHPKVPADVRRTLELPAARVQDAPGQQQLPGTDGGGRRGRKAPPPTDEDLGDL